MVEGLAVVAKGDKARGGDRFSGGGQGKNSEVGVAAGLVGVAPGDSAATIKTQIAYLEGSTAEFFEDCLGGVFDGPDELRGAKIRISWAMGY